jgi:hypothetical protein
VTEISSSAAKVSESSSCRTICWNSVAVNLHGIRQLLWHIMQRCDIRSRTTTGGSTKAGMNTESACHGVLFFVNFLRCFVLRSLAMVHEIPTSTPLNR